MSTNEDLILAKTTVQQATDAVTVLEGLVQQTQTHLQTLVQALAAAKAASDTALSRVNALEIQIPTRLVAPATNNPATDTTNLQTAIDAVAQWGGGIVTVPAGRYQVDAVKSVVVKKGVTLQMDPLTLLVVRPNAAERYYALRMEDDSTVIGGQIIGDRLVHTFGTNSTHEWGYGIGCSGNRTRILDTMIVECTGDGISLSGDDVEIRNVRCLRNRRQGMSVFTARRCRVYDSEFSYTGNLGTQAGTLPMAGVDIEPDGTGSGPTPLCEDVQFIRCKFNQNTSAGAKSYKNTAATVPARIVGIQFLECEFEGNTDGLWLAYCEGFGVKDCRVRNNSGYGLHVLQGSYTLEPVSGNEFQNNLTRAGTLDRNPDMVDASFILSMYPNQARDIKIEATAGATVVTLNTFR